MSNTRVTCTSVTSNESPPEGFTPGSVGYRVTLHARRDGKRRQVTVPFFHGPAICHDPTASDVLECIVSDAYAGQLGFADFCDEYGYDHDSRDAERTHKACQKMARRTERFLSFVGTGTLNVVSDA